MHVTRGYPQPLSPLPALRPDLVLETTPTASNTLTFHPHK
jgi:hypothetical protein